MKTYKKLTSCIFAMFICLCIVLPVIKANNFFRKKEETQDRNIAIKNISIPRVIISEALKEEAPRIDAQAVQKEETASVAS